MTKTLLWVFGVVFVVVGVLGWVPNPLVGDGAMFHTNTMHDLVHLVIGAVLILVAMTALDKGALTMKVVGGVYLAVAALGFFMAPEGGMVLGLIDTNAADHWLHVVLGAVLLGAGFMAKEEAPSMAMPM